jgi:YcxB-like protein
MENKITFHYEMQDFLDAYNIAHNIRVTPSRLLKILLIYAVVIISIPIGLFLFSNFLTFLASGYSRDFTISGLLGYISQTKDVTLGLQILAIPLFALLFLANLIGRFRLWLYLRKNQHVIQEERNFSFSDQGITRSTSTTSSNIQWSYFQYAIEGPNHFLLLKTKDEYAAIPKRIFSKVEEEQFRNLIKSKLGSLQKRS